MRNSMYQTWCLALGATTAYGALQAQSPSTPATVLVADMTFYGEKANSIEPGDSATAQAATTRMRSALRESGAFTLTDSARTSAAMSSADLPGVHCSASVECVRRVAQKVGARWAVMGTVSKLSNLIWYLSGQLIDVDRGRIVLDDGFELKGPRDEMVPRGAASLARRVAKVATGDTSGSRGE